MTTVAAPVSFSVDPWDPGYGMAFGEDMGEETLPDSTAELDLDLELPAGEWRPLTPDDSVPVPQTLLFLDGVRRIDARIWVHGSEPQPAPGIAASFAAGLVCCNGSARISEVAVERGLFTAAQDAARHRQPACPLSGSCCGRSRHGQAVARLAAAAQRS